MVVQQTAKRRKTSLNVPAFKRQNVALVLRKICATIYFQVKKKVGSTMAA